MKPRNYDPDGTLDQKVDEALKRPNEERDGPKLPKPTRPDSLAPWRIRPVKPRTRPAREVRSVLRTPTTRFHGAPEGWE